ncbi:alpha/beta-Hydrolase [Glarea lozoyensis ATCC 20868]|uniref:Carboxylic ester hydrolase n=1 Tax=Glarea lozoyensis (strain ATCC 20868 / MF5171) TaxID=1116229 RepID=S3DL45_GLAL2|nr:alpha/beta-Hydrolase [Glarea lozoyensis ATCC 20868]EPE32761.1 alpha/beta-Hydrolase [Glarea lozoyensis ATCC 20868]
MPKSFVFLTLACFIPCLLGTHLSERASGAPKVTVKNGTYVGFNDPVLNTDNFYGVAYAAPAIGDLRFRPPTSLNSSWEGERVVVDYPKQCITTGNNTSIEQIQNMSEDCLYMGIIRPSNVTIENLPVLVYLDQGGFANGGVGWLPDFNQTGIVQRSAFIGHPIIEVSVNSRLGPWGFMYSQEIQDTLNTNLGLRDMRFALQWIQEYIAAFGGDPNRVTIQGQSTGAQSVGLQLLAYGGKHDNLFQAAISESGAPVWHAPTANVALWQPTYNGFVNAAGCGNSSDSLNCLRSVSNETLVEIFANKTLNPFGSSAPREYMFAVDGDFIPEPNSGTGVGYKVANTTEELNVYLIKEMLTMDNASLATLGYLYPDIPEIGIPSTYDGRPPATSQMGSQYKRGASIGGDIIMHAPTRLTTLSMASFNSTVYRYHFNVGPNGYTNLQGSTHASEVALTFYDLDGSGYTVPPISGPNRDKLLQMANTMTAMWIGFVYYGDPNSIISSLDPSIPHWPKYELPNPQNYVFTINETLYTESDTYRAPGINYMMDLMVVSKNQDCTSIAACGGGFNITNGETGGVYGY